ncbi:AAA family ATPase [Lederbergia wuyishanensis]|uniref:Shikimate kinase n=1 Tax=Lederbergia wuyishanensis TaxID=1347903 RepID=A0ABU0D269_9BACI|nr:AAA family ATPase [Lederbergia wuyishanensis]MCJ8007336.1 AAA family ATPase [Lederbergia wuyishanensis]MDQ0342498.1 shikimate kinase [Lederbergia wuyishanensis]
MKFVLIVGPQAVGKMTVGQELEKITDLKLFHNHMTIEMVTPFFSYGTDAGKRLVKLFREEIFKEVANSDLPGLIFTYVCAFNMKEDLDYMDEICQIFESKGGTVYFVELEADVEERLERNKSPHRLVQKPTKRNIEWSERDLLKSMEKYRLNSIEGEINREHYLRINNTNLGAEEVAKMIKEEFQL